jgi:hypothetical protein
MSASSKISLQISPGRMPNSGLWSWRFVGGNVRLDMMVDVYCNWNVPKCVRERIVVLEELVYKDTEVLKFEACRNGV